jgi:hypothetical protein
MSEKENFTLEEQGKVSLAKTNLFILQNFKPPFIVVEDDI